MKNERKLLIVIIFCFCISSYQIAELNLEVLCFIDIVADACLVYIDEPGLSPDENERLFHETLKAAYVELQKPQYF